MLPERVGLSRVQKFATRKTIRTKEKTTPTAEAAAVAGGLSCMLLLTPVVMFRRARRMKIFFVGRFSGLLVPQQFQFVPSSSMRISIS